MVKVAYERWSFTRNSNNYYKALTQAASKSLNWPASRPWPYTHFGNEIGFFQEVLRKNHLLCVKYLGFDWCGWLVLIKSQNSHYNGNGLASQFWQIVSAIWKFWCFWLVVANERWSHTKVWLFIKINYWSFDLMRYTCCSDWCIWRWCFDPFTIWFLHVRPVWGKGPKKYLCWYYSEFSARKFFNEN